MTFQLIINTLTHQLISTYAQLDGWLDKDALHQYKSPADKWNVLEVLVSIALKNKTLLDCINDQACKDALNQAKHVNIGKMLENYSFGDIPITGIESFGSQSGHQADGIDTAANISVAEMRRLIRDQLHQSLCVLDIFKDGEGILYKTLVSVDGLMALDVYQYLYFIVMQTKGKLEHLKKIEEQYNRKHFEGVG